MSEPERGDVLIAACGPAALRVTGISGDRERDWRVVHHLTRSLSAGPPPGYIGAIPAYESVLIEFDLLATSLDHMAGAVAELLRGIDADAPLVTDPRHLCVPVLYGEEYASDLEAVAEFTGLDASDVVRLHGEPRYTVRCLGAPGGSPMLDGPAFPVPVPRLSSPRASVPIGAVSVAGRQATITPTQAPGGWYVIGRTPLRVLDLAEEPPVPYRPGDTVSFHAIGRTEFDHLDGDRLRPREVPA